MCHFSLTIQRRNGLQCSSENFKSSCRRQKREREEQQERKRHHIQCEIQIRCSDKRSNPWQADKGDTPLPLPLVTKKRITLYRAHFLQPIPLALGIDPNDWEFKDSNHAFFPQEPRKQKLIPRWIVVKVSKLPKSTKDHSNKAKPLEREKLFSFSVGHRESRFGAFKH